MLEARRRFLKGEFSARAHPPALAPSCLALSRVMCRACADACGPRAIHFLRQAGSAAVPRVEAAACTGCGDCIPVCPVSAITMRRAILPS